MTRTMESILESMILGCLSTLASDEGGKSVGSIQHRRTSRVRGPFPDILNSWVGVV